MQFNSGEKVLYRWDEFCIDGTMANRSDEENYLKNRIVFVCVGEQESQNFVDVLQVRISNLISKLYMLCLIIVKNRSIDNICTQF